MIKLTNLADYGVMLMTRIAQTDGLVQASGLATSTGLPAPTIAKILNILARQGLLKSYRGQKGGFSLSRPAKTISLTDIIECLDGPIALTNCTTEARLECEFESQCCTRPHWGDINKHVRDALTGISLDSLTKKETGPEFCASSHSG